MKSKDYLAFAFACFFSTFLTTSMTFLPRYMPVVMSTRCRRCVEPVFESTERALPFTLWCERRFAVCARVCLIRTTIYGNNTRNNKKSK